MVQIQLSRGISVAIVGSILLTEPAIAQVQPDGSLGNQSSVVNRNGGDRTLIQGGAMRGKNLFHSFSEFNVNRGEQVYFTQPLAIENIISRVTGKNASTIEVNRRGQYKPLGLRGAQDPRQPPNGFYCSSPGQSPPTG